MVEYPLKRSTNLNFFQTDKILHDLAWVRTLSACMVGEWYIHCAMLLRPLLSIIIQAEFPRTNTSSSTEEKWINETSSSLKVTRQQIIEKRSFLVLLQCVLNAVSGTNNLSLKNESLRFGFVGGNFCDDSLSRNFRQRRWTWAKILKFFNQFFLFSGVACKSWNFRSL